MFGIMPLVPAYGRDYTSAEKAQAAFRSGIDFATAARGYCSCRDFKAGDQITIRYSKLRKVTVFDLWH